MLVLAIGILHTYAPEPWYLWLFAWFAAATVAAGTLVLFAILGAPGQLVAMVLFVYVGLASAGGTVPVQALPGSFRFVSPADPLREILEGIRAIMYFDAQANAGLIHGIVATAAGLAFWLALGAIVITWYDRKGLFRIQPERLAFLHNAVVAYADEGREQPPRPGSEPILPSVSPGDAPQPSEQQPPR